MHDLSCIVHYNSRGAKYSKIKPVSSINKTNATKPLRKSLGGVHHHKEQCDLIPETINKTKHGIHLEPCCKKFTIILSQKDVPNLPPPPPRKGEDYLGTMVLKMCTLKNAIFAKSIKSSVNKKSTCQ